eukprot:CAMPEP_0206600198 /NCGR_PEP_ID=MMETSP0325_2-20121206/45636_1 /ASSEMBLY_ACC=CAM_ASM_000347 /TAXON_ID=2866 /ORGANISM="Crypthecodinium cohnii, Strain Seligo" /LENGTH=745 /DNA_ID=CAMNT_0054111423 /DNA_START=1 /DNA_END=2238 /DNA_ORIENTATION=-
MDDKDIEASVPDAAEPSDHNKHSSNNKDKPRPRTLELALTERTLRANDKEWIVPSTAAQGLCAVMLKDEAEESARFAELASEDFAIVEAEAMVTWYGDPRRLMVVSPKEGLGETPSVRLKILMEQLGLALAPKRAEGGPWIWALLTQKEIEDTCKHSILTLRWQAIPSWLFCLPLTEPVEKLLGAVRDTISPLISYACAWNFFFVQMMWILAALTVVGEVLGQTPTAAYEEKERIVWEIFKILLLIWGICLVAFSFKREQLVDPGKESDMVDLQPILHYKKVGLTEQILRAILGCTMSVVFASIQAIVIFFYVQVVTWLAFSWGDCIELGCRDPQTKYGFWGWLAEVAMDILQAALFAGVLELSKALASLSAGTSEHQYVEDHERAVLMHILVIETIGKLAPYIIVGLMFVPDYSEGGLGFVSNTCMDKHFVNSLNPTYMLCIARHLSYERRQDHFIKLFKGPFLVSPFIAILMKVIVPMVALWLNRWANSCWTCQPRCLFEFFAFITRVTGLIFTFEQDNVGCCQYLFKGHPFGKPELVDRVTPAPHDQRGLLAADVKRNREAGFKEEKEKEKKDANAFEYESEAIDIDEFLEKVDVDAEIQHAQPGPDSDTHDAARAANKSSCSSNRSPSEAAAVSWITAAIEQGSRKRWDSYDEMLEVNLYLMLVLFMAPMRPWGIFGMLGARLLETQTDFLKLFFVRCRPKPHGTQLAHAMRVVYISFMLPLAIGWSALLTFVIFRQGFAW